MITENELYEILKANKEIKEWYDCFYDNHSINDYYESELWVIAKAIIDKIEEDKVNEDDIYHDWKVKHPGL